MKQVLYKFCGPNKDTIMNDGLREALTHCCYEVGYNREIGYDQVEKQIIKPIKRKVSEDITKFNEKDVEVEHSLNVSIVSSYSNGELGLNFELCYMNTFKFFSHYFIRFVKEK